MVLIFNFIISYQNLFQSKYIIIIFMIRKKQIHPKFSINKKSKALSENK